MFVFWGFELLFLHARTLIGVEAKVLARGSSRREPTSKLSTSSFTGEFEHHSDRQHHNRNSKFLICVIDVKY